MEYNCETCKYKTSVKQNYDKHNTSVKHKKLIESTDEFKPKCIKCDKILLSRSGLWRHIKNCKVIPKSNIELPQISIENTIESNTDILNNTNMLKQVLEKQYLLEKLVIELSKNQAINITNNNNNNFNLKIYLNDKCNNAINIQEFMESICIGIQTIKNIESIGYMESVANIITEHLNKYSLQMRPIHYTNDDDNDAGIIYIRSYDEWIEETDLEKPILENAISYINEKIYNEFDIYQGSDFNKYPFLKKTFADADANPTMPHQVATKVLCKVIISSKTAPQ